MSSLFYTPGMKVVRSRAALLCRSIAVLLLSIIAGRAQTYTSPNSGTFTNPLVWNFGAGPVPASDAALALTLQSFGTGTIAAGDDLNLTLNTLNLAAYGTGGLTLNNASLNGGYAFAGGAGAINLLGSGATSTLSAGVVLGQGLSSLTFNGAGASGLTISGVIASNTSAGAPMNISTGAANSGTGVVSLSGPNTFSGGVVLNSGALSLSNARALGDRTNALTVNGGILRVGGSVTVANNLALNQTLHFSSVSLSGSATLAGALSGSGGVTTSIDNFSGLVLTGINTYTGATKVQGIDYATAATTTGGLTIQGAVGSIMNTSAIQVGAGGAIALDYGSGNSAGNARVSTGTAMSFTSGFLNVRGNAGIVRQNLGTVNAGGLTTIVSDTSGALPAGAGTEVTIANLNRAAGTTVSFFGRNLGGVAVAAGTNSAQSNVVLTQLNGAAPSAALVGGGGPAGATNISILPWALGDTSNPSGNYYVVGSGFVTYDTNGVRFLNTATEYNTANDFTTAGATENMRITGAVTNPTAPSAVNSVFFATTGLTIGGANALTITSGALASNVAAATISAPVNFGAGGAGEGVASVVGQLSTTNLMTLSGNVTAASFVKSGHGRLVLSGSGNSIPGSFTIDGGQAEVSAISQLGGATSLAFYGHSYIASRAELRYTGAGADTFAAPVMANGGMAGFNVTQSTGTLNLNGNISGAGGIRKDGPGTLVLGGTNTYTGGTYLGAGTLQIDSDARLGDAANPNGNFLGFSGGTLQLTGAWTSARAINVDAVSNLDTQSNNATLSGPITGSVLLDKLGGGTLTITGADNRFSGTIFLGSSTTQGGTLALSGAGALNSASVTFGVAAAGVAGTYVLDLSGATAASGTPWRSFSALNTGSGFTQAHTVQLGASASAPVDLRVASGTFGQGTSSGTGLITGFGKLVKVGTGTLTLANGNTTTNSTFTGGVEIWGGTLAFSADNQLGNSANNIVIQSGILNNTGGVVTSRTITLGATPQPIISGSTVQTLVNGVNAGTTLTLNGAIGGAGGFNKSGTGTVTLGAATNNYAGDTQITAGTLAFTDNAQLGAASSRLRMNGGTLQLAAAPGVPTTYSLPRTVIATATGSLFEVADPNATLDLSGSLVGTGAILKTGPGKCVISANNFSYFGTFQIGTSFAAAGGGSITGSGQLRGSFLALASNSGGTFDMSGLTRDFGAVSINDGTVLALGTGGKVTAGFNNADTSWNGSATGDAAASVTKVGTGTLTWGSSTSTFSGGFYELSGAGNTAISNGGTLPLQSALTVGAWGNNANKGPRFSLDNSIDLGTRIDDTQIIHSNAGEIVFISAFSKASSETIGSLRGAGMSTVTISGGTLNFGDSTAGVTRINRGTFLFRASNANMGTAGASTTIANLTFGNLPGTQFIGGGGAPGTTTISILPYAAGDISNAPTAAGSSFVTYGANGVRVLNTTSEVNASLTGAAANENVRLANGSLTTTQLTGGTDETVNSLSLAGTASTTRIESAAAEKLIIDSGALLNTVSNVFTSNAAGTAGVPLGIQVAELQTGNSNARELNVFATGGDLAMGAKVTTSGGLTKSGAANLFLTNTANTYTGATTINAGNLVIDTFSALGGSTTLQIGGGFLKYRGGNATLTQSVLAAGGEAANPNGGSAGFHIVSGTTLTVPGGGVSGFGGILKDGTGVLKLQGTNNNSGATIISGGALAIDNPGALGTNNRVIFADGISTSGGQTLRFDAPMTLTQDFITNTAQAGIGIGFDTNGNNLTLSGTILDARSTSIRGLYKFGAGELNLTATEMYTGPTQVFGGTLRLSGANGSILNSTGTGGFRSEATVLLSPGTSLVLDNAAANNNNRLPDVWDTPFGTGNGASGKIAMYRSELKIIGNAAGTSERVNQMDVEFGTVTLQGGGTTLTSGKLNRVSNYSGGLIRGTNLGGAPGLSSTNWFVTDLGSGGVQLGGAGGAKGTPFVNILPGFIGDTSATGSGTDFVTYAADVGFRTLTAGEYTSTILANNFDLNRAPNVALTGAATVNQTTAINALKLGAGASLGGSGTLVLGQSTVLATGNASVDVPSLSTNLSGASPAYDCFAAGAATTLTVNSTLPGSGRLVKNGDGTLLLNGRWLGTDAVTVAQGTLQLGAASAALNPTQNVGVMPGAVLDLGGTDRIIGGLATVIPAGNFNMGQVTDGTVALGANRLTLYFGSGTQWSGNITGTGGLTKAFFSTSTITFTGPQSYTGSTIVRGGTLRLADAGTLASNAVEIRGGGLEFINTDDFAAATGYIANRIGTSVPVSLAGGSLTFTENDNTPGNHSLGAVTLAGGGTVTITNGANAPSTVTIANLTRSASHGTLTVIATNLGLTQSPIGNARVFLTQIEGAAPASALVGGGGAIGTTTQSILPWAWSTTANSFLTFGSDGLRPLATSEYETALDAPTSNDSNIRTTAAQALTAPRTVNSLIVTSGNVSGAFDLTVGSGALTSAASATIGVNTNALLTGAGNTRELVVNTPSATTLNYNLTASGGVTKFGSSTLTLGGTNTFTGGLTINQGIVSFTSDASLGAAGGAIRFGGTTASGPRLSYAGSSTLAFNRPVETTSFGTFDAVTSQHWQINQPITGSGGIGYANSAQATFEINAANSYTGPTTWSSGHLYVNSDSAFGSGGELILNAGPQDDIVLRGNWSTNRLIHAAQAGAIQTNGFDATWTNQLVGTGNLDKNGNGNLIVTEPMAWSGALNVHGGTVRLVDRGSIAANTRAPTVYEGAALTLDDTGTHFSDRMHDSSGAVDLVGGEFRLLGSSSATTEEVFGVLDLEAGAGTVTLAAGAGQSAIVRLSRTPGNGAGAASLWRGTNLGVNTPGTADSANVLLTPTNTNTFPLSGGAAPAGNPSIGIIRGGFGDTSASGLGTQLVTYDLDKGVRLLNPNTEYTTTLVNGSVVTDNVKADGSALAIANATAANSLWLSNGASVTGAGTLTLSAATILVTGTGNTIANTVSAGSNVLVIGGPGDLTFISAITSTSTGGLIKMGGGTLTLNTANSYVGTFVIAAGIVALSNASAFPGGSAVQIQGGEIRNVSGSPLTLTNNFTLNGTMTVGGAQDLTFNGPMSLSNATRTLNVTNTGVTTIGGVIFSSQTLINYGLTKIGPGLLVLSSADDAYDGETTVAGGELRVTGSIAARTLTTVASGTLSGTGTVGAFKIAGGTLAPGTSVGTLTAGNTDFSGGTFSIEIAGAISADKLSVTGTAGLSGNTALTISLLGGYVPAGGESWTIIDNDGADAFSIGSFRFTNADNPIDPLVAFNAGGTSYYLDYAGGTGNDVVLHAVPEPGAVALLATALPLVALRCRRYLVS